MSKQIFQGEWNEMSGKIQQQWGKLTDNDLHVIEGNNKEIYGLLQKYYGYAKDEVKDQVEEFLDGLADSSTDLKHQGRQIMAAVSDQMASLTSEVKRMVSRGGEAVSEKVQEKPLMAVGAALSIGVILGYLFGRK